MVENNPVTDVLEKDHEGKCRRREVSRDVFSSVPGSLTSSLWFDTKTKGCQSLSTAYSAAQRLFFKLSKSDDDHMVGPSLRAAVASCLLLLARHFP